MGHIPRAKLYNLYDKEFLKKISKLDKNKTYLVYCRSGHRSSIAVEKMKKLGFKKLYNMLGGFIQWTSKKYPVEK